MMNLHTLPESFFTPDRQHLSIRAYAFLILLCVAFFTPGLVNLPPTDRDESLFAQASKQMIESGNYADIRFQDNPRYKKPVGIYWLQVASVKLFNPQHLNEIWAYRLPSFAGATLAVIMTAALGSLLFGPAVGLLAAIMMAGCAILNIEARTAKTDAALLATIMVAQYALAKAYLQRIDEKSWGMPFAFWTAIGIGILLKGPIILLVMTSTLLWIRLTEKNLSWFKNLRPATGILYAALLVMPWFIVIACASHGAFFQQSAGHDMIYKIIHGADARGIMPPGLHLLVFPFIFFPFALFAFLAAPDSWANRQTPAVRFCLGWIIPTWLVFEFSLTKLPHYVMPAYPAIAMLSAKALLDGYPVLAEKSWRWLLATAVALWMMVGSAAVLSTALLPYFLNHTISIAQILAGGVFIVAQGVSLFLLLERKPGSIIVTTIGGLIFFAVTLGNTLPNIPYLWPSQQIVEIAETTKRCDHYQLISASYDEPSLVFLAGTNTMHTGNGAEAAKMIRDNPCAIAAIDSEHSEIFLKNTIEWNRTPLPLGKAEGFSVGAGRKRTVTLYQVVPKTQKAHKK